MQGHHGREAGRAALTVPGMTQTRDAVAAAVFTSGEPLVTCDADLRVRGWNEAAEALTGIPSRDVIGRPCWEAVDAVDESGATICRPGCLHGRLARAGCAVRGKEGLVRGPGGRRRVLLSTVTHRVGRRLVILHLLQAATREPEAAASGPPSSLELAGLTARQREVLALLAEGVPAKTIAGRLGVRETTVRNHIRAILMELGCHSQLEAIARARRAGAVLGLRPRRVPDSGGARRLG